MISKFFGFRGRIGRGTWWLAQIICMPVIYLVGTGLLLGIAATTPAESSENLGFVWGGSMFVVIAVGIILGTWINFSSTIQRYHDRGKSGFWCLLLFVPLIGAIWVLIECGFCSGEDTGNEWGPPPGAARARENLVREIDGLAASGTGNALDKLDDDYLRAYASRMQKPAEPSVQSSPARTPLLAGNARPVFGKR